MHRTDIFKGKQAFFGIPQVFNLSSIIMISILVIFVARFLGIKLGYSIKSWF